MSFMFLLLTLSKVRNTLLGLLLTLSKVRDTLLGLLLTLRFVIMGCGSEEG